MCSISVCISVPNTSFSDKYLARFSQINIGVHVKSPLNMPDINQNLSRSTIFHKTLGCQIKLKSMQCFSRCFMHTDSWLD
jgi:hypothetical protein